MKHSDNTHVGKQSHKKGHPLFSEAGQVVATLKTDRNGTKYVSKSIDQTKHALHTPPGLAIDQVIVNQAKAEGAQYLLIRDRVTAETWSANFATLEEHGFPVKRGHGLQIGLSFAFWKHRNPDQKGPDLPATITAPKVKQFDLSCYFDERDAA